SLGDVVLGPLPFLHLGVVAGARGGGDEQQRGERAAHRTRTSSRQIGERAHRIRHVPFVARLLGPQVASAGGASARLWPHCPTLRELPYMAVGSSKWSLEQSAELYNLPGWGHPYFSVREDGTVHVHPNGPEGPSTSLVDVIASAKRQGMSLPLLLRF